MAKKRKNLWKEAERAAEHLAVHKFGCILTRRSIRTMWQKVDFFGADVVGKKPDGSHVYIQVTSGQAPAVSQRKRKLEKVPWHETDTVVLAQYVSTRSEIDLRRYARTFHLWELKNGEWMKLEDVLVPTEWTKPYNVAR